MPPNDEHENAEEKPVELPIDGTLDLHAFHPREVKTLVRAYLEECRLRGILEIRVIHGKGTGQLRERVHSVLRKLPYVESFGLVGSERGSWGATVVVLRPR